MSEMLSAALSYVNSYGFSVIPLQPGEKKPAQVWGEYTQRKPSVRELIAWFSKPTRMGFKNLGIVCGNISQLVVFDADSHEKAKELMNKFEEFKETARVRTKRGVHFYFTVEFEVKSAKLDVDLDLKGENSYVVAPPSVVDEHKYTWESNDILHFVKLSGERFFEIIETLKNKNKHKEMKSEEKNEEKKKIKVNVDIESLINILKQHYIKGERQNIALYLAGVCKKEGVDANTTEKIIKELCKETGDTEIKQRLDAVKYTYLNEDIKAYSGLHELGIDVSKIKNCFKQANLKLLFENFYTDDTESYVYDASGIRLGPLVKCETIIQNEKGITYEFSYKGKTFIVEKITDFNTIIEATGKGIVKEKKFLDYLNVATDKCNKIKRMFTKIGWLGDEFVHPCLTEGIWDKWFMYNAIERAKRYYKPQEHLELIKKALKDGKGLGFVYVFCFSSILLKKLNCSPSALFIEGPTRVGKTTLGVFGINLFLPGEELLVSSNTTSTGFELLLSRWNGIPLLIDELGANRSLNLEQLVFTLGTGKGKVRGTKHLNIDLKQLNSHVIFTNEISQRFVRPGTFARFLKLEITDFIQDAFSMMNANEIQKLRKIWGGGVEILKAVLKDLDKINTKFTESAEEMIEENKISELYNIALPLLVTIDIFEQFFSEDFSTLRHNVLKLLEKQAENLQNEKNFVEKFLERLKEWILLNYSKFHSENKEIWGKITKREGKTLIYVLQTPFLSFLEENGFSKILLNELAKQEILLKSSDKKYTTRVRIASELCYAYCFCLQDDFEYQSTETEFDLETVNSSIPF